MSVFQPRARIPVATPKPIERLGDSVEFGEFLFSFVEDEQGFKLILRNPLNGNIPPVIINIDTLSVVGDSEKATESVRELTKKKLKALDLVRESHKATLSARFTQHSSDPTHGTLTLFLESIWIGNLYVGIEIHESDGMSSHPYVLFYIRQDYNNLTLKGYPSNN
jgi:hypothetical protein